MLIRNDTSFVANAIIYILQVLYSRKRDVKQRESEGRAYLKTAFTEELISGTKWYLNDGGEFGHLLGSVILDVGNTLDNRALVDERRSITGKGETPQSKLLAVLRWPSMR